MLYVWIFMQLFIVYGSLCCYGYSQRDLHSLTMLISSFKWAHFKFWCLQKSQKSCHGGNKGLTKQHIFEKIQFGEHLATKVNWHQVSNMISCKRDVLEKLRRKDWQRLSVKESVKRLWNTLKTTLLNIKLQRLCKSHPLQCITSSKDS